MPPPWYWVCGTNQKRPKYAWNKQQYWPQYKNKMIKKKKTFSSDDFLKTCSIYFWSNDKIALLNDTFPLKNRNTSIKAECNCHIWVVHVIHTYTLSPFKFLKPSEWFSLSAFSDFLSFWAPVTVVILGFVTDDLISGLFVLHKLLPELPVNTVWVDIFLLFEWTEPVIYLIYIKGTWTITSIDRG